MATQAKARKPALKHRHRAAAKKRLVPKSSSRSAGSAPEPKGGHTNEVSTLRQSFALSRKLFSRLCQYSERAIADWEAGDPLAAPARQKIAELKRLYHGLSAVMEPEYVGEWLQIPNDSFESLKPLEVVERGQIDRIWRMIYLMESGVPA